MTQEEFNRFYDHLRQFANRESRKYFGDPVLSEDAAIIAVDCFTDAYIGVNNIDNLYGWAKDIIIKSLRKQSSRRKLEPIKLDKDWSKAGFHGYCVKP